MNMSSEQTTIKSKPLALKNALKCKIWRESKKLPTEKQLKNMQMLLRWNFNTYLPRTKLEIVLDCFIIEFAMRKVLGKPITNKFVIDNLVQITIEYDEEMRLGGY